MGAQAGMKAEIQRCLALLKDRAKLERILKKVANSEREGVSSSLKSSKLTSQQLQRNRSSLEESFGVMDRQAVDASVVCALCVNGIPFNVFRNPEFCKMLADVNNGPEGYQAPSEGESRIARRGKNKCRKGLDSSEGYMVYRWCVYCL